MFSATLFDFNGVLVDDELVHRDAFLELLTPHGVGFSDEDYDGKYIGLTDAQAIAAMFAAAGRPVSDEVVRQLVEDKRPLYRRRAEGGLRFFDGAGALVRRRAAAGPVGIVSGALRDEISFALGQMGLLDLVAFVISAGDAPLSKPDPASYLLAVDRLTAIIGAPAARRCLVIEDSLAGVVAARRAGLVCLAVAHSFAERQLYEAGADLVAPQIGAVTDDLVRTLYQRRFPA